MQTAKACRVIFVAFAAMFLVFTVGGCSSGKQTVETTPPETKPAPPVLAGPDRLVDTQWLAASILGKPAGIAASTLSFNNSDAVSGSAGCNNYKGSVNTGDSTMEFGALATTRKFCEPSVNGQETVFLEALALTRSWDLSGTTLELLDEKSSVLIRFNKQ